MRTFLIGCLLLTVAVVTGKFLAIAVVALILLLAKRRLERRERRRKALDILLHAVGGRTSEVIARPGVSRFMPDAVWPQAQQWDLVRSIPELIVVRPRPGAPRHYPPDVTGLVLSLTDRGRLELRRAVSSGRFVPRAHTASH